MNFKFSVLLTLICLLTACQTNDGGQTTATQLQKAVDEQGSSSVVPGTALQTLPSEVSALLSNSAGINEPSAGLFSEERFDVKAEQVAAAAFFSGLVEGTPFSVAIHPQVQGTISLDLKQVTLQEALDLTEEMYGYDVQRSGNVFRVYPSGIRTETFTVNYLLMTRDGTTQSSIMSGGVSQFDNNSANNGGANNFGGNSQTGGNQYSNNFNANNNVNGTNILTRTQTDFWKDLKEALISLVGGQGGRSVIVSPQAGLVTVRAMPDELRSVREFLSRSQQTIQRQVVLEARIIEVSLNDDYQQGVNWNQVLANVGSTDFRFSTQGFTAVNSLTSTLGGAASLAFVNKDFSGVINLLSTQGNVQVLSSPRVTAINNQKAVIKVGDDEYFVTDVSSQSTISSSTTAVTPNIELTPFFSGIALDVTPQIDEDGSVLLHVHPSVIETEEQEKVVTLNEEKFVLPLAQSNIRESDTIIHARSGEIVVIGGLMQTIISESHSKTPVLGNIPLLGELFKNRREVEQKKELIILLRPTVVGPDTWRKQLMQSRDQVRDWIGEN
ncbi:pilus (MSHA type) biogenesis protein MshL [Bowmanella yangjiangensis]|uniref:Pilus (MSHA type) biogenesis protein MshL n=1 Tax=Bowmanella yangjiangensis TaxID=2811230 RepID=A0ABS3CRK8_9ALTE|nr:pilus (MSHA type) biogenesis protein MshL [Bowmanella yangjiangensis]MBN7819285.1 pilus (MSHA type) biogenesis protein MshL [Bowmanella yangjiangensis]